MDIQIRKEEKDWGQNTTGNLPKGVVCFLWDGKWYGQCGQPLSELKKDKLSIARRWYRKFDDYITIKWKLVAPIPQFIWMAYERGSVTEK